MIKIEKLKPFQFYRLNDKISLFMNPRNMRKDSMVSILSPSIEDELALINGNDIIFTPFSKYYMEKVTFYKYYKQTQVKVVNTPEEFSKENIDSLSGKNLLKNMEIVMPLPTSKVDILKGFNFIYEVSHVLNNILINAKDQRMPHAMLNDILEFFREYYVRKSHIFSEYKYRTIIIPVDQWLPLSEYTKDTTFKKTNHNFISILYMIFNSDEESFKRIFKDYKIVFTNKNEYMVFDPSINNEKNYADLLKLFLKKCRSTDSIKVTNVDDEIQMKEELERIDIETKKDIEVDKLVGSIKLDISTLEDDVQNKIYDIAKEVTSDNKTEIVAKDIKSIETNEDLIDLLNAKMEGLTVGNYKRNKLLKEKYTTMNFKNTSIPELLQDKEIPAIIPFETNTNTINENLKNIKSVNFAKSYNEGLNDRDIMKILLHFMKTDPSFYMITEPIIEDVSDEMNRMWQYVVEYEDATRKRHKLTFLMPKFYKDKYLFINDLRWDICHQKFPYPVTKIGNDIVQCCSNYRKMMVTRKGANISPRMTKLLKVLCSKEPENVKVYKGDATAVNKGILSTIEYSQIAKNITRLDINDNILYFNSMEAMIAVSTKPPYSDSDIYTPIGIKRGKNSIKYYLNGTNNIVYDQYDKEYGELSEFIINMIGSNSSKTMDEIKNTSVGSKFMYSEAIVMDKNIPLILVLSAGYPIGHFHGILDMMGVEYELSEKRLRVDKDEKIVIEFSDKYLYIDRYPFENALMFNGMNMVNTKEYTFDEMGIRDTYIEIFDTLYGTRTLIDGITNFHYLFMDPITEEVCNKLNYPNTYEGLLIYANGLLVDDEYESDSSYNNCRIRSNEIINVYLYQALADAYKDYKIGRNPKFSIKKDEVIKRIMGSNIIEHHTQLNIVENMENDSQIRSKGPVGLNVSEAYTIDKRAFHSSMNGIIALNTIPSGEVGVTRHLTANIDIADARGFININDKEKNSTELLSAGELMSTFAPESADAERVAMAISQTKHLVPTLNSSSSLVSYDMGPVAAKIATDFSHVAKSDGKVIEIMEDIMIVQYSDGTYDDIDMSEKPDYNSSSGFYIMNKYTTDLKVGSSFKTSDIIAYNPKYINNSNMFSEYCALDGPSARIAVVSQGSVYEDSTEVAQRLAQKMSSYITMDKEVILSKYSNIKFIVKPGDSISAKDPLIIFDDTKDEFTSEILKGLAEDIKDDEETILNDGSIKSKVSGRISSIRIINTVPIDELSPSLQKIVKDYNQQNEKRKKFLSKYIKPSDSNTILNPSGTITPDKYGKVGGVEIGEGVRIIFFIEYLDVYGVGDKLTHYGALKGINNNVIPLGLEGFTESNPDRKIDAYLSQIGDYKRMVLDVSKVGIISKILIEVKRQLKDEFLDELKKL